MELDPFSLLQQRARSRHSRITEFRQSTPSLPPSPRAWRLMGKYTDESSAFHGGGGIPRGGGTDYVRRHFSFSPSFLVLTMRYSGFNLRKVCIVSCTACGADRKRRSRKENVIYESSTSQAKNHSALHGRRSLPPSHPLWTNSSTFEEQREN